ncbi:FAD-dependent monooxygenase [Bartonella sp. DGB1]|uniref:FAD-dependent monooxygenase n=1 Tax=Bartonella sp. DGB1 TaxID=3239807 RepID=UPI003524225F
MQKIYNNISPTSNYDIIISGASYTGQTLAIAIKQACPFLKILLVESRANNIFSDRRSSSISPLVVNMFQALDIWSTVASYAQPVKKMILTDSLLSDPIRSKILTLGDNDEEILFYMLPNINLLNILQEKLKEHQIDILYNNQITSFSQNISGVNILLKDNQKLFSKILIAADGKNSKLREIGNINICSHNYKQTALVFSIEHKLPHNDTAIQHFLNEGILAILPLIGNRSSVVWSLSQQKATNLLTQSSFFFKKYFEKSLGKQLGNITIDSDIQKFDLSLMLANEFARSNFYLVGDAAHSIHPLAGQGLNLGMYDVAFLAELLVQQVRVGLDLSSGLLAESYQASRRFDCLSMAAVTHSINKIFSTEASVIQTLRDVMFKFVDNNEKLKYFFTKEMGEVNIDMPKLLQGEKL